MTILSLFLRSRLAQGALAVLLLLAVATWWVGVKKDEAVERDRAEAAARQKEFEDDVRERSAPGPVLSPSECRERLREGRPCGGN